MSTDDAQQRIEIQELGGALLKLGSADATAASLLTKLFQVVADEAARTPRFAKALSQAFVVAPAVDRTEAVAAAAPRKPARKAAPRKVVKREAGLFDPFAVFKESGEDGLTAKLTGLTVDQIRDIIADQEIDSRRETGRKRKAEVLVEWTVDRVKTLASKGSVFR